MGLTQKTAETDGFDYVFFRFGKPGHGLCFYRDKQSREGRRDEILSADALSSP